MSFLRRIMGGGGSPSADGAADGAADGSAPGSADVAADEQARDRELLLEEARRLDDELIQRQLRFADRSWTPAAQGGPRRADDADAARKVDR